MNPADEIPRSHDAPLLIAGSSSATSVSSSLLRAGIRQGMPVHYADLNGFTRHWGLKDRIFWRLFDRQFLCAGRYEQHAKALLSSTKSRLLLVVGNAPLRKGFLAGIQAQGVRTGIWLTDDPWNPSSKAQWMFDAIAQHDLVFTPRTSNQDQLTRLARNPAIWMPFAVDSELFPPKPSGWTAGEPEPDVLFVGGGDREREEILSPLMESRLRFRICGAHWKSTARAPEVFLGQKDAGRLRDLSYAAKVNVILNRRSNRDGHTMRTYEVASMGGCLLIEWSTEHETLFGKDGECVTYFRDGTELREKAERLCADDALRLQLAANLRERIGRAAIGYGDRLVEIYRVMTRHAAGSLP